MMIKTTLALLAAATALSAQAAIDVNAPGFTYNQNFDSLANSGAGNTWTNDITLSGWSLFVQPTPGTAFSGTYSADAGGSNSGGFKSLGSDGSSERALGGVASGNAYFSPGGIGTGPASGAVAGWIVLAFQNNTGGALNSFMLDFDGEQWRNANTGGQTMTMEYGFGSAFGSVGQWTAPGASFNWTSPVSGGTTSALDGNAAGNRVAGLGGTVAVPWSTGDTLWLRWAENNDIGSDHALAIDNLSFSVTAVPEPETYALMLAGLATVATLACRRQRAGARTRVVAPADNTAI